VALRALQGIDVWNSAPIGGFLNLTIHSKPDGSVLFQRAVIT